MILPRILTLGACVALSACVQPIKVAYDWEEFEKVRDVDSAVVDATFDATWSAAKGAAIDMQLTPVAEDVDSGILTFVKPDEEFSNASYQLTVRLIREDSGDTRVWLRAFIFTSFKEQARSVMPSDGSFENEFFEAMQQRI